MFFRTQILLNKIFEPYMGAKKVLPLSERLNLEVIEMKIDLVTFAFVSWHINNRRLFNA